MGAPFRLPVRRRVGNRVSIYPGDAHSPLRNHEGPLADWLREPYEVAPSLAQCRRTRRCRLGFRRVGQDAKSVMPLVS